MNVSQLTKFIEKNHLNLEKHFVYAFAEFKYFM